MAAHFRVIGEAIPSGLDVFEIELPRIDIDYLEKRLRLCETVLGAYHWVSLDPLRAVVVEPEQAASQEAPSAAPAQEGLQGPPHAPAPRTTAQRLYILEDELRLLRGSLDDQRKAIHGIAYEHRRL